MTAGSSFLISIDVWAQVTAVSHIQLLVLLEYLDPRIGPTEFL